jgi:hypothetical protein
MGSKPSPDLIGGYGCWRYAQEVIIKEFIVYLSVHGKYLHPMV